MKARWLFLLPIGLLVVLVGVSVSRLTGIDPQAPTFESPQRPAPVVSAPTIAGEPVDFSKIDGPVIVNFWATWCTPCKAEHPYLVQMKEQGAPIIGVLHKDQVPAAQKLLASDGDPFSTVALDPQGDVSLAFGLTGVPETFLIDANGMIVKTFRGPLDAARARDFLEAWKAEAEKAG